MKGIKSFIIAVFLFIVTCFGLWGYSKSNVYEKRESLIYYNTDSRNSCKAALELILKEDSIPVFGSSELSASDEVGYPPSLFNNGKSDFNMILMGRGYMQSLHHAMVLGGIADIIPHKKVVLILSPQWFSESHLDSKTYASRFSERMYSEFLKNPQISYGTKKKVTDRMKVLLKDDPQQLKRVEKYENVYMRHSINPVLQAEMRIYDCFMDYRQLYRLGKTAKSMEKRTEGKTVTIDTIDFGSLLEEAQRAGEEACTNNDFYIYNEYYDNYVRDNLESRKDYQANASYGVSQEYDDLRIFLEVCRETGIDPLLVSIPVNGRWYDWTGFPKEGREVYYQNIRDICEEYQVEIADFSDREYEEYFLKDIMHLGWKGWVYLDEAVYNFYTK